nr:hypothetical protein [Mycobacteroides abscessus]
MVDMALRRDQVNVVEHPVVRCRLSRKPHQCVPLALELKSGERAIDYREIDSDFLAKTQLFDDPGRIVTGMLDVQAPPKRNADVVITHRTESAWHYSPSLEGYGGGAVT